MENSQIKLKKLTFQEITLKFTEQNAEHRNQRIKYFKIKFSRTKHERPNRTNQSAPCVQTGNSKLNRAVVGLVSACDVRAVNRAKPRPRQFLHRSIAISRLKSRASKPLKLNSNRPTSSPTARISISGVLTWRNLDRPFYFFF